jgi:hypothetical protein
MVGDHMGILGAVVLFTFYLFFLPSHTLLPLPFFSYLYIFFLPSHTLFLFLPEPTDLFLVGGPLVTRTRTARLSTAAASEVHQKFAKSP